MIQPPIEPFNGFAGVPPYSVINQLFGGSWHVPEKSDGFVAVGRRGVSIRLVIGGITCYILSVIRLVVPLIRIFLVL